MPDTPAQFTTVDGTLTGAINGANTQFAFTPPGTAAASLLFTNGLLDTQPLQGVTAGNMATLTGAPIPGNTVTVEAWTQDPTQPTINPPFQASSVDGSITGTMDGDNNVFTLSTPNLVTDLLLWWNGGFLSVGQDFNWTCLQNSSAGPWITTITTCAGNNPQPGDILTAQAFTM